MATAQSPCPPPLRVEAGPRNREKRLGLSDAGRERLRQAPLAGRAWEHSTGPRTAEGKARSADDGKLLQKGPMSVRERRAEAAGFRALIGPLRAGRKALDPGTQSGTT